MFLLIRDQNKHVGAYHLGVEGSLPNVSTSGNLVRDLLATEDWLLVDNMGRSLHELKPFVSKLYIDSTRAMGVAWPVREKGRYRLIHSDHYPCLLTLRDMPWTQRKLIQEKKY